MPGLLLYLVRRKGDVTELQQTNKQTNKLRGLSLRTNYIDRATAACRRSDCQIFANRGCHVVSVTDPYGRIFRFIDYSLYYYYYYYLTKLNSMA
jgi:hypothetical protein